MLNESNFNVLVRDGGSVINSELLNKYAICLNLLSKYELCHSINVQISLDLNVHKHG